MKIHDFDFQSWLQVEQFNSDPNVKAIVKALGLLAKEVHDSTDRIVAALKESGDAT
jgi:hypothetical protein